MTKKLVYIASPYTVGDKEQHVRNSIEAAELVVDRGAHPFIPLLTHYWDMLYPKPSKCWYLYDYRFLDICDYLLVLPGPSIGVQEEIWRAQAKGIKIMLYEYLKLNRNFAFGKKEVMVYA
jgi:hypothetical protein